MALRCAAVNTPGTRLPLRASELQQFSVGSFVVIETNLSKSRWLTTKQLSGVEESVWPVCTFQGQLLYSRLRRVQLKGVYMLNLPQMSNQVSNWIHTAKLPELSANQTHPSKNCLASAFRSMLEERPSCSDISSSENMTPTFPACKLRGLIATAL